MDRITRAVEVREIRERYDRYQARTKALRDEVLERLEQEVAERVAAERLELSKFLHEKYALGVTKGVLREGTRKYGNTDAFRALWDPAADLFTDAPITRAESKPYRIENGRVIVTRNEQGPVEEFPIYAIDVDRRKGTVAFWPDMPSDRATEAFPDLKNLFTFMEAAFIEYGDDVEQYATTIKDENGERIKSEGVTE